MTPPVRATTARRHEESVFRVLRHCEEHLDDDLRLADLAEIGGFSPYHFHRVFQEVTGETPKAHLRRLRLERAVYRLKASPDQVLRIAVEAGFQTHETFTRAFARRFDITPSDFRAMLRALRGEMCGPMTSRTFEGFTDETPLTLRFDVQREPVSVEHTPARHLIFVRHTGYERLLADGRPLLDLWSDVLAYAGAHAIEHGTDTLIAVTPDDPYTTEEERFRFDACLPVSGPVRVSHPFGYRYQPAGLCVTRRHRGGLEEVAKTFAQLGVAWLLPDDHALGAAPPFEVHHLEPAADRIVRTHTDVHLPLQPTRRRT